MIPLKVSEILRATNGRLISGNRNIIIKNISTDSRSIEKNEFFCPLVGEKFDGHQFINRAVEKGCSGFFTKKWNKEIRKIPPALMNNLIIIKVDDTLKAYQDVALCMRKKLKSKVIAITGSTGKTGTKDMLALILKASKAVCAPSNFNNEIGVPYTILEAKEDTEIIVLELAMRGKGQIKELAEISLPNVGVVTNVGLAHFEFLNSREDILRAKAELVKTIPKNGWIIFNNDDKPSQGLKKYGKGNILTFGLDEEADIYATHIKIDSLGHPSFKLHYQGKGMLIKLPLSGKYHIYNALAAAAVALTAGVSENKIKRGLALARVSENRMEVIKKGKTIILNDTYNANPASMRAALENLKTISSGKKTLAILGDMLELGKIEKEEHLKLGEFICELNLGNLVAIGKRAIFIERGAEKAGMQKNKIKSFENLEAAEKILNRIETSNTVILVKGSRAMGMERIVNFLKRKI